MPEVDPVILELRAELGRYLSDVTKATTRVEQAMERQNQSVKKLESNLSGAASRIGRYFAGMAAAAAAAFSTAKIIGYVDSAKQIEAQLRLATNASGSFAKATEDVQRIAATTRNDLDATAKLYGNFQRNAAELGITQLEAARATETVAKAFKISGASAQEAGQGIRQLVQGLQSGTLRGDEFNTIMEAAPRLARLFADALGVLPGDLRAMAEAGELTARRLTAALTDTKFTDALDAEFKGLPVTFGEAMTAIENAATITFGAFDKGGEFSKMLVNFALGGSQDFADLAKAAERMGLTVRAELAGIGGAISDLLGLVSRLNSLLGGIPARLAEDAWIFKYANPLGMAVLAGEQAVEGLRNTPGAVAERNAIYRRAFDRQEGGFAGRWNDRAAEMGLNQPEAVVRPAGGKTTGGRKKTGPKGPSAESIANKAEQERVKGLREEASNRREMNQLEDAVLQARRALAVAAEDVLALELEAIDRQARQQEADIRTQAAIDKLGEEEIRQKIALVQEGERLLKMAAQRAAGEQLAAEAQRDTEDIKQRLEAAQTPMERYLGDITKEAENLSDAYEEIAVRGLQRMNSEFSEMAVKAMGLHGLFGQLIRDLIEMAFRQFVVATLMKAIGAVVGSIGGPQPGGTPAFNAAFADIAAAPKMASGGQVSAGRLYQVNERGAPGSFEGFIPGSSGKIVPLSQMNQPMAGGGRDGGVATVRLELSGDIDSRIQKVSGPIAIEVYRAGLPGTINAAANEALSRARRPRV